MVRREGETGKAEEFIIFVVLQFCPRFALISVGLVLFKEDTESPLK